MTEYALRSVRTVSYALVVEGLPTIYAYGEDLTTSWAVAQGFVDTHPGLRLPASLPKKTNPRASTLPTVTATFEIDECRGTELLETFGGVFELADELEDTLEPGTTAPAALYSKHVGIERIGAAGERGLYPAIPGATRHLRHVGLDRAPFEHEAPALVSTDPVVHEGRRVAFYRVFLQDDGSYQDLADAQRVWWGVLLDGGKQRDRVWSFTAAGPDKWLEKSLGRSASPTPFYPTPVTTLTSYENSARVEIKARYRSGGEPGHWTYGNAESDDYFSTAIDYTTLASELNTLINTAQADNSADPGFANSFDDDEAAAGAFGISWLPDAGHFVLAWKKSKSTGAAGESGYWGLEVVVILHEKVWLALGFDPRQQNDQNLDYDHEHYVDFVQTLPDGYWSAVLTTGSVAWYEGNKGQDVFDQDEWESGNRAWKAAYKGGVASFKMERGQEFLALDPGQGDQIYLQGQLTQPPLAKLDESGDAYELGDSAGAVNAQRLFLFWGPYRELGKKETITSYQIVRCSWRDDGGKVAQGFVSPYARFVIQSVHEPRRFNLDNDRITGTWLAPSAPQAGDDDLRIQCMPINECAYKPSYSDRALYVWFRLMLGSGTADKWYTNNDWLTPAFDPPIGDAVLKVGSNDIGSSINTDADILDLGLDIPSSMVQDLPAVAEVWNSIPDPEEYGRGKEIFAGGPKRSVEIFEGLYKPRFLAWSLAADTPGGDGKYGVFDPLRPVTAQDVADRGVTITPEDYAYDGSGRGTAHERLYGPISAVRVQTSEHVLDRDFQNDRTYKARDAAAAYRANGVEHRVVGPGLLHPSRTPKAWQGSRWSKGYLQRQEQASRFWAKSHIRVRIRLKTAKGERCLPGTPIMLTDPDLIDGYSQAYGVTSFTGYATGQDSNPRGGFVNVELLLHADSAAGIRLYGPVAFAYAYDPNAAGLGYRLLCKDDILGFRKGGSVDVSGFVEPSTTSYGGNLDLEIFQLGLWGDTWQGGAYAVASSVVTTPGKCAIHLTGAPTGTTLYRDTDKIVVPRNKASQTAAWALALLGFIGDEAGEVGGSPVPKFNGI